MELFKWKNEYSVGNAELDGHHKELINLVNDFYTRLYNQEGKFAIEDALKNLSKYVIMHFNREEAIMKQYDYPHLSSHQKEHEMFKKSVADLERDFQSGKIMMAIPVGKFLKDWVNGHILGIDKKYSSYIIKKAA